MQLIPAKWRKLIWLVKARVTLLNISSQLLAVPVISCTYNILMNQFHGHFENISFRKSIRIAQFCNRPPYSNTTFQMDHEESLYGISLNNTKNTRLINNHHLLLISTSCLYTKIKLQIANIIKYDGDNEQETATQKMKWRTKLRFFQSNLSHNGPLSKWRFKLPNERYGSL